MIPIITYLNFHFLLYSLFLWFIWRKNAQTVNNWLVVHLIKFSYLNFDIPMHQFLIFTFPMFYLEKKDAWTINKSWPFKEFFWPLTPVKRWRLVELQHDPFMDWFFLSFLLALPQLDKTDLYCAEIFNTNPKIIMDRTMFNFMVSLCRGERLWPYPC